MRLGWSIWSTTGQMPLGCVMELIQSHAPEQDPAAVFLKQSPHFLFAPTQ